MDEPNNAKYEARDLKIDVFGAIGLATDFPEVGFMRNGENVQMSGRQTLVFLNPETGWKLVREHGTVKRHVVRDVHLFNASTA